MSALTFRERHHVFDTMGTTVSLAFAAASAEEAQAAGRAVEAVFHALDQRFSLYRPQSEASAIARRELPMTKASPQMRSAYRLALDWCEKTEGAFSATRPDGSIDLSGVVKALAIQGGGDALRVLGLRDWCLNAGGDVLTDGTRADGTPWVVGIVDPQDRLALLTQYACDPTHPAVATSGVAERGEHVWRTGEAGAEAFVQVTVGAPDIVTADVLATAILAGGQPTLDLALATWDVEVIAATRAGALLSTPAFRA